MLVFVFNATTMH